MERGLARLAAAASGASARDGAGIVLYEDAARRRVTALAGALRALRTLSDVALQFKGAAPPGRRGQSVLAAVGVECAEQGLVLTQWLLTAEPSCIPDVVCASLLSRCLVLPGLSAAVETTLLGDEHEDLQEARHVMCCCRRRGPGERQRSAGGSGDAGPPLSQNCGTAGAPGASHGLGRGTEQWPRRAPPRARPAAMQATSFVPDRGPAGTYTDEKIMQGVCATFNCVLKVPS